ncbi:MAG TPA: transketolase C-terminal domain-containing protein [Thermoplasmata archaeon]|nr:transketolase C-terminal domain-containing protein [Thermoplasmata archaeon]
MSSSAAPLEIAREVLRELQSQRPDEVVIDVAGVNAGPTPEPAPPHPLARGWILCSAAAAMYDWWVPIRTAAEAGGSGPKVLATYDPATDPLPISDFSVFGSIPRMMVGAPADGPSCRAAVADAAARLGPVYLRLPSPAAPTVSNGTFGFGRAPVLRSGNDLTVVGVGGALPLALALADRLVGVGVSVRVLDGASVKPLDAPALVRAARETGAILTVEEHHALTGYGAGAAVLTAGSHPVMVRRVGLPDLPIAPGAQRPPAAAAAYGLSLERLEEEAWGLLRAKGKVQ